MQQPPPTDPKTDLRFKCWLCEYTVLNPCHQDTDGNCKNWEKRCKSDEKLRRFQEVYFFNRF